MATSTGNSPKVDFPLGPDSALPGDGPPPPADTAFAPSWFVPLHAYNAPPSDTQGPSTERLWAYLMGTRVLVALGLFALQVLAYGRGKSGLVPLLVCATYLVATAGVLRWSRPTRSDSVWSSGWALTLWVDLAVFGLLQTFQHGDFNYTPLFVLPVLLAAIIGPAVLALGSAALATLILLFDAFTSEVLQVGQTTYVQGAISGAGLFLVALLAHQLAARLGREQAQARWSHAQALAESQVNQLIVTGLNEGVVVMDVQGHIWHANPAACAMLGAQHPLPPIQDLMALPAWRTLSGWARTAMAHGRDDSCEVPLPTASGAVQQVLLRARVTAPNGPAQPACVIFMENLRDIEARVRNEKLAAMGRVSAAVAHEIRNPLAAIAQANALLAEDSLGPAQQRLTHMIGQNAKRIGRTVDDILDVAKLPVRPAHRPAGMGLDATVATILADWQHQHPGSAPPQWSAHAPEAQVGFDPEHLRRVLVNLLDNARKHAPAGSPIQVGTALPPALEVWNPGPPLPAHVAEHLFEPFTSSHSRSSGLGLYLSRELCRHYGAQLTYQPSQRQGEAGHGFVITFIGPLL